MEGESIESLIETISRSELIIERLKERKRTEIFDTLNGLSYEKLITTLKRIPSEEWEKRDSFYFTAFFQPVIICAHQQSLGPVVEILVNSHEFDEVSTLIIGPYAQEVYRHLDSPPTAA